MLVGIREDGGRRACLGILYYEVSRREDQGHQRGGEEHLDYGHIAIVAVEDLGERVCMVDPEALGCACGRCRVSSCFTLSRFTRCSFAYRRLDSYGLG